ncbi:MAG: hypothetical protein ABI948_03135 [Thermoleophilia bacterium]
MPRACALLAVAVAAITLASPLASGASADGTPSGRRVTAQDSGTVTLRLRQRLDPWKKSLYVKLVKNRLYTFSVCGIRNWDTSEEFQCESAGTRLPERASMRLEQAPVARALKRSDSPGWGMLGVSSSAKVGAVLGNTITGNRFGKFRYRVTVRSNSGELLATSNVVTVTWHR